jgi:hypothetical protein
VITLAVTRRQVIRKPLACWRRALGIVKTKKKSLKMGKTTHLKSLFFLKKNVPSIMAGNNLEQNPKVSNKTKIFMGFIDLISRYFTSMIRKLFRSAI